MVYTGTEIAPNPVNRRSLKRQRSIRSKPPVQTQAPKSRRAGPSLQGAGCNTHQLDGLRIVNRLTSLSAAELLVVRVQPCGAALRPVDRERLVSLEMLDLRCWILPREILVFIGTAGTDLVTTAPFIFFYTPGDFFRCS